jgi:hypothetical protein
MGVTLYNKFTQHRDLKRELLATGDAELIEVRETYRIEYSYRWLTCFCRTQTKTRSGAVGWMEKEEMNLGKLLNIFALNCVKKNKGKSLNYVLDITNPDMCCALQQF